MKHMLGTLLVLGSLASPEGGLAQIAQWQNQKPVSEIISRDKAQSFKFDQYILGPGDGLEIELLDLPELSGYFTVGPDGTIYLPRLRALFIEGLTIEELRIELSNQYGQFVLNPEVYIRPVVYRPVRIYVRGEVFRPGYYTLSSTQVAQNQELISTASSPINEGLRGSNPRAQPRFTSRAVTINSNSEDRNLVGKAEFPTLFDAIRAAQGITPHSNLGDIVVTRKLPISRGQRRIQTNLSLISLIAKGNESQNIRLMDGDVVYVSRSEEVLKEQLLEAGKTNLSPQYLEVFVSGRVKLAGGKILPQGSSLNQAIDVSGGPKILHGRVEFIRFNRDGTIERRDFRYSPDAGADTYENPVLMSGDVVRVKESVLSAATEVIGEITEPALGVFSIYSLFGGFN